MIVNKKDTSFFFFAYYQNKDLQKYFVQGIKIERRFYQRKRGRRIITV